MRKDADSLGVNGKHSSNYLDLLSRGFAIIYALLAYGIGSAALFWFFFAFLGLMPYSLSSAKADNLFAALSINTVLVLLFAPGFV